MDINDLVAQIVTLPRRFHSLGNTSMFSLLDGTGYFGSHDQISEADIRAALVRSAECVEEWIQYSEDKRTCGWYVMKINEGWYEIGHVTVRGDLQERRKYEDCIDACAAFVKREIESIRLA